MTKRQTIISLIANVLIFLITVAVVISYFFVEPNILIQNGWDSLRYFTTDSNILAALAALITAVWDVRILTKKSDKIPKPVLLLKFVGTACVNLTMIATVCFLMPVYGTFVMSDSLIVVHVITPLLAVLTFMLAETVHKISIPASLLGTIPMMLYGIVYYVEVKMIGEANGGWKDFYAYNRGGQWFLSLIFMTAGCFVVAILTAVLHNLVISFKEKRQTTTV